MRIPQSSSLMSSRINLRSSSRFTADTSKVKKGNGYTDKIDLMNVARNTNADSKVSSMYKDIQTTATKLDKISKKLMSDEKKDVKAEIESFVKEYNSLNKQMNTSGNKVYTEFSKDLKNEVITQQKALAEIGISYVHDGTLSIDKKKLESASAENIKKVFLEKNSFSSKVASKASYIEKRSVIDNILSGSNMSRKSFSKTARV